MKKLKSLLLFFVCGLVACTMAIPLAACNDGTGGGGGGTALRKITACFNLSP